MITRCGELDDLWSWSIDDDPSHHKMQRMVRLGRDQGGRIVTLFTQLAKVILIKMIDPQVEMDGVGTDGIVEYPVNIRGEASTPLWKLEDSDLSRRLNLGRGYLLHLLSTSRTSSSQISFLEVQCRRFGYLEPTWPYLFLILTQTHPLQTEACLHVL